MFSINNILEYIFPKRKDFLLVQHTHTHDITSAYAPLREEHWIALTSFAEPSVRACIHEIKYFQNERAAMLLGTLLETYLHELHDRYVILPIPLGKKRRKKRTYNQVERIAAPIVRDTEHTLNTNVLYRTRETEPQTNLQRTERIKNMREAFSIHEKQSADIQNKHVIILDDVVTTGATLHAAKAALEKASPASVTCIAIAH